MMSRKKATAWELRIFSLSLAILFGVAGFLMLSFWLEWLPVLLMVLAVVLGAVLTGWIRPNLVVPVYKFWKRLTYPIQWLVTQAMLSVVFFLLVLPIGLLRRMLGHDSLKRKIDRHGESYWLKCESKVDKQRHFRQY